MTTKEERLKVLKMIQSGQVTADEGARLLESLRTQERDDSHSQEERQSAAKSKRMRMLRIRVTDLETGAQKVDMRLPWGLVNAGINLGARFARDEIEMEGFVEAVQAGTEGKIMEVIDEEDAERVEIFVE